jgi:excisionase family DNA binding protein
VHDSARVPKLLTPDETAEILRTTRKAVYAMFERGQIPSHVVVRLGRRLLFREEALVQWLSERGTPSP